MAASRKVPQSVAQTNTSTPARLQLRGEAAHELVSARGQMLRPGRAEALARARHHRPGRGGRRAAALPSVREQLHGEQRDLGTDNRAALLFSDSRRDAMENSIDCDAILQCAHPFRRWYTIE